MTVATAPERVRAPAAPTVPASVPDVTRQPRRSVDRPGRREPGRSLQRTAAMCAVFVVCSLLLVAGASAFLTQGQVRLTRLQQQLNTEFGRHRNLENRVARLVNPDQVVSGAQGHGLTAPTHVTDLPATTPTTAPVTPHASTDTTVGR